jgi:uncharacterized protein (TIGR00255 family)
MMVSMTGFGQAQGMKKGERFVVTLKSVNHRYFETSFHLPLGLDCLEAVFRSRIQKAVKRGRVTISISHLSASAEVVVVNQDLVEKYYNVLEALRKKLKLAQSIDLTSLLSLPGAVSTRKEELKDEEREALLLAAVDQALRKLIVMRKTEGAALAKDLKGRISRIGSHMTKIKKQVASVIGANKKSMSPEELESFLRSTDVSEEITRIDFHLKNFLKQTKLSDPMGKVLDFIGQELQREVNTLGAKVQDKHVAYEVVLVKDQIEKIREQVQNVE